MIRNALIALLLVMVISERAKRKELTKRVDALHVAFTNEPFTPERATM